MQLTEILMIFVLAFNIYAIAGIVLLRRLREFNTKQAFLFGLFFPLHVSVFQVGSAMWMQLKGHHVQWDFRLIVCVIYLIMFVLAVCGS